MGVEIFHLNLVSPIYVIPEEDPRPFQSPALNDGGSGQEKIFCYELDEVQCLAFEPDQNKLFGRLIFGGVSVAAEGGAQIPKGNYLFAQRREILNKDEIIAMAVEIQMEGLWQRLKPLNKLYLRYLFEDGSWVTQLYRPYS